MDPYFLVRERMSQSEKKEDEIFRLPRPLEDVPNLTESLIESIGSGIIITEMNDTITYINQAGEEMLCYSKGEVIGKPFSLFGLKEKQNVSYSFLDHPDNLDARREGWMKRKDELEIPVGFTI
ncbi:MAG: PAS domain-containing protein, partial [Deltaproteobacteria bacterium]|nr:PAS domain-containing protein [Deltaproteobacteria bacterium]